MAYSLKVSVTSSTGEDVFNLDLTVTGGLSAEEGAPCSAVWGTSWVLACHLAKLEQLDKMVRTSSGQPLEAIPASTHPTSTGHPHPSLEAAKEKKDFTLLPRLFQSHFKMSSVL